MTNLVRKDLENHLVELYHNKNKSKVIDDSIVYSIGYVEETPMDAALKDVDFILKLSEKHPLEMQLYQTVEQTGESLHLRFFEWKQARSLSDVIPMLEYFGLRTECVNTHSVSLEEKDIILVSDFTLDYIFGERLELNKVDELFQEAFSRVYLGLSENDGFNKLILAAALSYREITILRALAKYLLQLSSRYNQLNIENTLANNVSLSVDLIMLFKARHDPCLIVNRELQQAVIEKQIFSKLKRVSSSDEDRIITQLFDLIKASVRTTFFQYKTDNSPKEYLAIKFNSAAIPGMPLPVPLFEIFVYSHTFEGIHLRKEPVARGGIRWSERPEDFRKEILDLMKAQIVKNSIIVPSGAKGGFVLKVVSSQAPPQVIRDRVIHVYKLFINALLDLTDNIKDGQIVSPEEVVCHDGPDPYLVVAADKGTATFSDIANELSRMHDFWLGDAFASGGSTGYDHKKMGITARGAWESIKRHFREMDHDISETILTVVGIGDLSGDVFGNGLLYSNRLKLIGAFDHRSIFLDPDPDPEVSFAERQRLFYLPGSSWEDYDPKLISKGGGVFKRSTKFIQLSPEMQGVLAVEEEGFAPNELICALLKAPVDLLFNGGIGTYVKSSEETAVDVGDRVNDYCRVNGGELRCKVVGEGGNLGFTQYGRIEYAENGGLINTDFIDNSAGVDCSDHEVNLKILLHHEINQGRLTEKDRDELLASLTDEIAELVLEDNHKQALVMSFSAYSSERNIALHTEYIKELEIQNVLNRQLEFLPTDKELIERKRLGLGLNRPELAVLLAYTKIFIKQEILKSDVPEDSYLSQNIETAFPKSIRHKYRGIMQEHLLKRDIIATQLSNRVINQMGLTYIYRMQGETGATVDEILRAYVIAAESFGIEELQQTIDTLNFKIPLADQFEIFHSIRKLINLSTRWFLRGNYIQGDMQRVIEHFSKNINLVEALVPDLMSGATRQYLASIAEQFIQANMPKEIAKRIATYKAIYSLLNIIEVATTHKLDLKKATKIYFAGGESMNFVWFRDTINSDTREDHWHALTRLTLRDELDALQKAITVAIIRVDEGESDVSMLIDKWMNLNKRTVDRWNQFLSILHRNTNVEYTMFFIAIRELSGLIDKSIGMSQETSLD